MDARKKPENESDIHDRKWNGLKYKTIRIVENAIVRFKSIVFL